MGSSQDLTAVPGETRSKMGAEGCSSEFTVVLGERGTETEASECSLELTVAPQEKVVGRLSMATSIPAS